MSQQTQHPYYNFTQHTPGPSQPQWQATPKPPRTGWGDPRISQTSPVAASSGSPFHAPQGYGSGPGHSLPPPPPPPPHPPPPSGGFSPASQINAPNTSQYDTSAWGVKYNQTQQFTQAQDNALRPPLPPRPSSAQAGQQQTWNTQTPIQKPPTPPPRPPEYATPQQQPQSHYFPHEQYSHRPSSHHYEPQSNQWSTPQQQPGTTSAYQRQQQQQQYMNEEPVSPLEQHQQAWSTSGPRPSSTAHQYGLPYTVQSPSSYQSTSIPFPGPSALGSGGPSNWEHFPDESHYYLGQPQQQPTHQSSQSFTATPEQTYALPAQSSPDKSSTGNLHAPPQTRVSISHQPDPRLSAQNTSVVPQHPPATGTDPRHARLNSDAASSVSNDPDRAGTIDSVIQAWSRPSANVGEPQQLKASSRPTSTPQESARPQIKLTSAQTQTDFPPVVRTETKVETKIETREVDPYEDLKDEYRTSLNRYATMLRQEKAAVTEQEKMKIVVAFVNKEIKLRSVMFNAEPAELITSKELAELRKAAEKAGQEEVMRIPPGVDSQAQNADAHRPVTPTQPSINRGNQQSLQAKDDGFVVVDREDDEHDEYSPGGRPRMNLPPKAPAQQISKSPETQVVAGRTGALPQNIVRPGSPGSNAPMTLDDYAMPDHVSVSGPGISIHGQPAPAQRPDSTAPGAAAPAPIHFQPARPAYTPFRYTEAVDAAKPTVNTSNPANEAYLKLRHEQATESGRLLSQEPPSLTITTPDRSQNSTPSRARQQQEEAFIGLLRQQSKAVKKPSATPPPDAPAPLRVGTPLKRRPSLPPMVKSTESLRQALPKNLDQLNFASQPHPKTASINTALAKLVDDFGFIHATVVAWDRDNRKIRQQLDAERATRESDSQSHIDQLFHDNEIGYADIAGLEEDFKLEEASKKYQEDQDELDSFVRNVFERVTERLENEVAELETLRIKTLDLLDLGAQSVSARLRTALKNPEYCLEKAPLADTMKTLLQIYHKIDVRYTKIAEAHFERERRRKRLELSVLYTNGDTAGVKKLEKDFDKAQAMQVLSEARKRDERANKLMDSFDRGAVRGLAENQEWVDEMSNKVSLVRDLVLGAESNGPQGSNREELLYGPGGIKETTDLLQTAVEMVAQDSRDLVQMSSQADKLLNEADFAMFLAEAQIADANEQEFQKLRSEKAKEDQKLKDESDGRMNGIQRIPDEIFGFIKDIRDTIGTDRDHQVRINQALEAAKKRNQSVAGERATGGNTVREV